jgi:hypothetical protein
MVNFLIWIIFKCNLSRSDEKNTMDTFWKELRWSLYWLWRGTWPTQDAYGHQMGNVRAGTPLAGGYYGTLWHSLGDIDWHSNTMGLEGQGQRTPCMRCGCNTTTVPWTEVHPENSQWLTRMWSEIPWRAAHPNLNPLYDLPGVGCDTAAPDYMHNKHLGSDLYTYGSILMMLTHGTDGRMMMASLNPEINMENAFLEIKHAYQDFELIV